MSCLFGLSTASNRAPSISLQKMDKSIDYRLGVAWYSAENYSSNALINIKVEDSKFNESDTSILIGCSHVNQVKAPFHFSYAGRDWLMACSGSLREDAKTYLPLGKNPLLTPIGISPEEHAFCWLLSKIQSQNVNSLFNLKWSILYGLLQSINQYGSLNIMLSDGEDLVVYHDQNDSEPFYGIFNPPSSHQELSILYESLNITFSSNELTHPFILFTNQRTSFASAVSLFPSQMVVIRKSTYIWDSHGNLCHPVQVPEKFGEELKSDEELPGVLTPVGHDLSTVQAIFLPLKSTSEGKTASVCMYSNSPDHFPNMFSIEHHTTYQYDAPIYLSKHLFRLQPVQDLTQNLLHYHLKVSVDGKACNFFGAFGNNATTFDVNEPYTELKITSNAIVAVSEAPPQRYDLLHQQWTMPLIWMPWDRIMMQAYLTPPELSESELFELSSYAMSFVRRNNNDVIEVLNDINRTIFHDFKYISASTTLETTPYEVFHHKRGVCQDFANLFICLARLLNIPARYRVGYIHTGTDYRNVAMSEASHAWLEVYLPNIGWTGFDPTNCTPQTKNHIRVACGRNYRDATPTSGTIFRGEGREKMITTVKVLQLKELDPDILFDVYT